MARGINKVIIVGNVGGDPETFAQKVKVLDRHCVDVGRDPSEIKRSCYATFLVTNDQTIVERLDYNKIRPPVIAGSADHLKRVVDQYIEAGADELIFSPVELGDAKSEREQYDYFMQKVISGFR